MLIINESPIYGGHEEMFIRHVNEFVKLNKFNASIVINKKNERFGNQLKILNEQKKCNLNIIYKNFSGWPVRPLTNIFAIADILWLIVTMFKLKISKVIVIQGTIEIGGLSLTVSRLLNKKTISYLPITKRSSDIGVKFGRLRDFINKIFYYKMPHEYITISDFNRFELFKYFNVPFEKIKVVPNFIDNSNEDIDLKKSDHGLQKNIFLIIGRIDALQKRQEDFLDIISADPIINDIEVHIIGDDNSEQCHMLRKKYANVDAIKFWGWLTSIEIKKKIKESSGVIIPSRYEGVPLVMIEAINANRVVFASNVDGMKEYLPKQWLFNASDLTDSKRVIRSYLEKPTAYTDGVACVKDNFNSIFNARKNSEKFFNIIESD